MTPEVVFILLPLKIYEQFFNLFYFLFTYSILFIYFDIFIIYF